MDLKPIACLLLCAAASPNAGAADHAITLYGAYRSGGAFTDEVTGSKLDVANSATGAVALDLPYDGSRQLQIFASHQRSNLRFSQQAAPKTGTELPMQISYLHVGGTYFFDGPVGSGPYVVGGIGATLLALDGEGYGNELRPSMNLGIGYQQLLGNHVALRVEGRFYSTVVNSSGGLFCSGGCVVSIQGDLVNQAEFLLGLSLPF